IAALARIIRSAAVSLGVCIHSAQIRASTCLALASSGAAFRAPNRKSSPRVRSAPTFGSLLGASGSFFWAFGGGTTWVLVCANEVTGTAVRTAAVTMIRQLRAPGNLNAMDQV